MVDERAFRPEDSGRLARFACLTTTTTIWRVSFGPGAEIHHVFPSNSINSHQRHPDLTRFFFETEMLQIFPVCMINWHSKGMFTPYGHFSLKILEFIFTRDISV